jgi:AraC-like DNA-binding protein
MKAGSKAVVRMSERSETSTNPAMERRLRRDLTNVSDGKTGVGDSNAHEEYLASVAQVNEKFEAFLADRGETREQFAERAGISVWTLRRVFPKEAAFTRGARGILNDQLLRKIRDATEGSINWSDIADRLPLAPALTRKFEAFLAERCETRAMFADRIGVTTSWLSRVFPLNPMKKARCLSVDAALRFCIGTEGYLTLTDFHNAGICPTVQDVIRLCAKAESSADANQASVQ